MDPTSFDDLELELRKLPGVRAAGFTERDDMLVVQVQVAGDEPTANLSQQAARIAYRHADKPVALEIVRWRVIAAPPPAVTAPAPTTPAESNGAALVPDPDAVDDLPRQRVRLLAVLTFPDTDELEVHLTFGGRRIIGRSTAAAGISGAATATLEGLQTFAPTLGGRLAWCSEVTEHQTDTSHVVACSVTVGDQSRLGIAAGGSRIEAAARATLHALNRALEHLSDTLG